MEKVRDRLWIWGHEAGSHNHITGTSRMTQAEGAYYLGTPNVLMVEFLGKPMPPFRQHAIALSGCKQVVWSVIGAGTPDDVVTDHRSPLNEVISLASEFPNITGAMMDDYFVVKDEAGNMNRPRASIDQLIDIQQTLHSQPRPLDLWVVVYDYHVSSVPQEHLDLCDVINFWTWTADNLDDVERNLATLRARVPNKRIVLGCYMWDYGNNQPISVDLMEKQCTRGLRWLKDGRIEGIVFLASCICDVGLEAVEWTRRWIADVGGQDI